MLPVKDIRRLGQTDLPTPPDKPLPSLPVATVQTGSPIVRRSLIDAGEKPLRRSISQSPGEKSEEDWPVLIPSGATTPSNIKEMAHDGSCIQAESSAVGRAGSQIELVHPDQQHIHECRHGYGARAADILNLLSGSQAPTEAPSGPIQARMAFEPASKTLQSGKEPPEHLSNVSQTHPPSAEGENLISDDCTKSRIPKVSAPGRSLVKNVNKSSAMSKHSVENTSTPQDGLQARVSRLPKRLSVPGPVRSSSSPRGSRSGRPSPYGSVLAPVYRSRPAKRAYHSNSTRKPDDQNTPSHTGQVVHSANFVFKDVPSLVAVKHTPKNGIPYDRRSSIPRPRNHFQLDQDAESESEIMVSKLSRKMANNNRVTSEHKSEDGDIDTDEGHERKAEKRQQSSQPIAEESRIDKSFEQEKPHVGAKGVTASSVEKSSPADHKDWEMPSSEVLGSRRDHTRSATDPSSLVEPYLDIARQRQMIDRPFNRVKRLSATAPDHGPVLRISDSADRIIMGYGSEEHFDQYDTTAQKLNSVPDLRRSVVVKELRKSTEGLLNGISPLSRSLTTRSLNRLEPEDEAGEAWSKHESRDLHSVLCSSKVELGAARFDDPFAVYDTMIPPDAGEPARTSDANGTNDWPLKSPASGARKPRSTEEATPEGEKSWISPLPVSPTGTVSAQRSNPPVRSGGENQSQTADSLGCASKRSYLETHSVRPENTSALGMIRKPVPVNSNDVRSTAPMNNRFPPRTSSRANTPDVSMRSRPQLYHGTPREIPNRFLSIRTDRLSEDFRLPRSTTIEPETLRDSVYRLNDNEKSKISTPIAQEPGRAPISSAKGMLSNFKGLFHKRSLETPTASSAAKSKASAPPERPAVKIMNGIPHANYSSRTFPASYGMSKSARGAHVISRPGDAFLQSPGLRSDDFRQATDLAMRVLDGAQSEVDETKKKKLLQVS